MIALVVFPLLGLATLIAMAITGSDDHYSRWELNEANPCCEPQAKKSSSTQSHASHEYAETIAA